MKLSNIFAKQIAVAALALVAISCTTQPSTYKIEVWPDGAPNTANLTQEQWENPDNGIVGAIGDAYLWVYLPEKNPSRAAVIICPGGAYEYLSMKSEGREVAQRFSENGYAAIVLQYRMPNSNKEVPISDVREAFAIVKAHADEWGIDPEKIGIMGFSAGGHLAAYHSNTYTAESKPAFSILIYPVTRLTSESHEGTRYNFLLNEEDSVEVRNASPVWLVGEHTPTTYLAVSNDDFLYDDTKVYLNALDEKNIPVECHIYPDGGHGWGMEERFDYKDQWFGSLLFWLNRVLNS